MDRPKVVIEETEPLFGNPSYYVSYYGFGVNNLKERGRVYCDSTQLDGHFIIRMGEHQSIFGRTKLAPYSDIVLGVTVPQDNIPQAIIDKARKLAQEKLRPPHEGGIVPLFEDRTLSPSSPKYKQEPKN